MQALEAPDSDGHFRRLFLWPRVFLEKLAKYSASSVEVLVDRYREGLSVVTDFSGVGSAEIACLFIEHGLKDSGSEIFSSPEYVGLRCRRASDSNPACRRILLHDDCNPDFQGASHSAVSGQAHGCIFGSLEERVEPEVLQKLRRMQGACKDNADSELDKAAEDSHRSIIRKWGREFVRMAVQFLQKSVTELPTKVWCYRHEQACPFCVTHEQGGIDIAIAGPPCVDWSQIGQRHGWLGDGAIPFLLWAHERRLCRERITIMENVVGFDDDILDVVFPGYITTVFPVSLRQLGIPAHRDRIYIVILLPGASWLLSEPRVVFAEIFTEQYLLTNSSQFYSAPKDVVDRNHEWQARTRGLPASPSSGRAWQAKHVMSQPMVKRVRAWEEAVRADLGLDRNQRAHVFMNAAQSAGRCGVMDVLPTLITNAHIWSMHSQRLLLVQEMWEVQGFSMFEKGIPTEYMCPFRVCVLDALAALESSPEASATRTGRRCAKRPRDWQLSHHDLRVMAGNSMSLQCMGAILLFVLTFVR
ncbi:unnamed protein product [Symbiodinium sp. CCMP2592]|nr:unnamed protein product [Symbiodinium sp. CCMP2592]